MRKFFYYFPSLIKTYHTFLAFLGTFIYNFPSRKIYVLGVTGTKGKSTTIELIAAILEAAGKKVAVSSSARNGGSSMMMPGRFFLQKFLRRAVDTNCDYALIEATSQGILQNRHRFIKWDAAIFTNLTPEHIEAHGGFEKYREAKLSFFRYITHLKTFDVHIFFINKDDDNAKYFIEAVKIVKSDFNSIILYRKSDLPSQLVGEFNQYNIGAAVAFARSQNISEEIITKAVTEFSGVPGRMEFIQRKPFSVVIDYAHTPDSLQKVYKTLQSISSLRKTTSLVKAPKLICVFGAAGGGRDKWKRPEMGKIAAEYCDKIILTNEDPYDENPLTILEEIESGFSRMANSQWPIANNYWKIIDRREAIKKGLSLARARDTVIVTGKGSEKWMYLAHSQKIPWNEKKVVIDLLKNLN